MEVARRVEVFGGAEASGAGTPAGAAGVSAGAGAEAIGLPQCGQNFAPGLILFPQLVQKLAMDALLY